MAQWKLYLNTDQKIWGSNINADIIFRIFIITFLTYYSVYTDFDSVWFVGIFYYSLFFFEWSSESKDSYHPQYHETFAFLVFLIHINNRTYILSLVYLLETYRSYLLKFYCYFIVFCELSRRVGVQIFFLVDKIF